MRVRAHSTLRIGIALCLTLGAPRVVMSQAPEISARRVGPERLIANPGDRLTLSFRLISRASRELAVGNALMLPPSWQLVIPDSSVAVPPGGSELALMPIRIPVDARAATYVVRYAATLRGVAAATPVSQDSVIVAVSERRHMNAEVMSAPRYVGAGDSYKVAFAIRNDGNAPAIARVQITGNHDIDVRLDSALVHMEPGEQRTVTAIVGTDARESRKIVQRVGITATIGGDTTGRAATASAVEVIPRRTRTVSVRHSLPIQLGLGSNGEDGRVTPELRGRGFLTGSRTSQVDFVFRPPAPGSFFASQDEYRMTVGRRDRYRLQLGDQSYGTARLTQPFRPGAGASGELTLGRFTFGAEAERDRRSFEFTRESQYGGSIDTRLFADRARVGVALLSRSGINSGRIIAGRGRLHLPSSNTFNWEYGVGSSPLGRGAAYTWILTGGLGRVTYGLQRDASDAAYPGLGAGITNSAANLRAQPFKYATVFGSAVQTTATFFSGKASLHRELEGGTDLTRFLTLAYRLARDTGFVLGLAKTGHSIRASTTLPLRRVLLGTRVESGYTVRDGAPSNRVPFLRTGANVSLTVAGQSLAASVDRLSGTPYYGFTKIDQTSGQITAGIRLREDSRLNVSYSGTRSPRGFGSPFSMLDIGFDQRLPIGHQAKWRGQSLSYGPGALNQRSRQHAQYLIPLSVPLPSADESGTVDVLLVEGDARRPVPGAVVRFGGDARMTNAAGSTQFSGITPGEYYLDLDRAYVGPDRIVTPSLPLSVTVVRGEKRVVELRLIGAAEIRGVVTLLEFGANRRLGAPDTLVDAGGQSHVRLQLTSNGDTLRTVSNGGGRFRFRDVRPGHWVLRVLDADMPAMHHPDNDRVEFDVKPGDARDVSIRLLPVRPTVVFIEEAEIRPTPAGAPARAPAAARAVAAHPANVSGWPIAGANWRPPSVRHFYTVTRHDISLMQIARYMYDDATLWPKIWVANLDHLASPDVLRAGQRLRIPDEGPLTPVELAARNAYFARARSRD